MTQTPRLSDAVLDGIKDQLNAYRSSGATAPKELLFKAADAIGALQFDAIDLKRQLAEAQRDAERREDKAYLRGLREGHNSGTDQAKAIASQTSYATAIDQAIQEQKK